MVKETEKQGHASGQLRMIKAKHVVHTRPHSACGCSLTCPRTSNKVYISDRVPFEVPLGWNALADILRLDVAWRVAAVKSEPA